MDKQSARRLPCIFDIQRLRRDKTAFRKARIALQQRTYIRIVPRGDPVKRITAAHAVRLRRLADDQRLPRIELILRVQLIVKQNTRLRDAVLLCDGAYALAGHNRVNLHEKHLVCKFCLSVYAAADFLFPRMFYS